AESCLVYKRLRWHARDDANASDIATRPNVSRRAAAGRPYRPGRTGTGSGAEEPGADPGARLALVPRAVLRGERLVGGGVAGGRRAGVPGRRQHLLRAGEQGARRLRLEVEAEPAQLVPVLLQVVGEEQDRPAGHREVEHGRRVVGDQD